MINNKISQYVVQDKKQTSSQILWNVTLSTFGNVE